MMKLLMKGEKQPRNAYLEKINIFQTTKYDKIMKRRQVISNTYSSEAVR